jgi:hypothetical protein
VLSLPPLMGKARASRSARELFGKSRGVNLLAPRAVFLFGARDVWFVVGPAGVPLRRRLELHDGGRLPGALDHRLRRRAGRRARRWCARSATG